jgi:sugar phosphate isomerase/epimerase
MIRLGGYGVPVTSEDPHDIARAHREIGYRAAYCPPVDISDRARLSAITRAFAAEDVEIAEVAAWGGVVQPDPATRKAARARVAERLAVADEVGARCAITYIGTLGDDSDYGPHPDNLTCKGFDAFVEAARDIIDAVKPKRAKFTLEMMQWLLPDSAEVYLELLHAIDRPAFAAHLDPVNLIVSPRQFYDTTALINRCFEVLGGHIVSAHAKDITLRGQLSLHLDEVIPGRGGLDYRTYLAGLARHAPGVPLMLEHLKPADYPEARDHIRKLAADIGIAV